MKIDIILPYKEIFSATSASAVSLTVKNSIEFSEFKNDITVYGQNTNKPFYKNFVGFIFGEDCKKDRSKKFKIP